MDLIEHDGQRARITENAYRDVVRSGNYTYARFVDEIESVALAKATPRPASPAIAMLHRLSRLVDRSSWGKVALYVHIAGALRRQALRFLPAPALEMIRRRVAGSAAETAALQSAD